MAASTGAWPGDACAGHQQVTANVAPNRLQTLIRNGGSLPGARLAPVATEAERNEDAELRRQFLDKAHRDALNQTQPLADLIGRNRLTS